MRAGGNHSPSEYLAHFGFVAGQHYLGDKAAADLATEVQCELDRRQFLNNEGFYFFEEYCGSACDAGCRGWDGKSPRCDCGVHHIPAFRFRGKFPEASVETPRCRCCRECAHVGSNTCSHCQRWLCDRCLREHTHVEREDPDE